MTPLRLGIAGCGWVALERHLPALARVPDVEVVALADPDPRALARAAGRVPSARQYESIDALADDAGVEAVAVCVPPAAHVDVALIALARDKHVLVEKPLAATLGDADRLATVAETSQAKVVVGFNFRRHRLVERAASMIANGEIGAVTCIRSAFTNDVPLDDAARWRGTRSLGGGGILDRAVHEFDLWRHLVADDVAEVFAYSNPGRTDDDVTVVTARMRQGALATIVVLDSAPVSHELTVYGTRATIRMDLCRFDGFSVGTAGQLPGSPRTRIQRFRETLSDPRGNAQAIRRGGDQTVNYGKQWRAFAEIVRRDLPAQPGVADGRAALEVALAAVESVDSGLPVSLQPLVSA